MMELTKDESKRILRRIELEAYSALVTALRAQGELDRRKKRLLRDLGEQLSISTERHRAEIRRAISDDRLSMIAECICGSDASIEWESEGRRVVPLMPRLVPQTAFTGSATAAANHAASVNSTIPSTTKGRLKDDDEEYRSRKRQRTSSPGTVQKVIVSSAITKTSTPTVRSNTKDSSCFVKATTEPVKQDTTQLPSMKMTLSSSGSSKPTALAGSKSSSVSVAPSKYVAPLPASCLQAHASVVSGNKNRVNLNIVKTKPAKAKIKSMVSSVKIKSASTGTSVVPSVVHTVAQSLLSMAKTKGTGKEVASSPNKTVQVTRSTSTISVAPRSSISLTTLKPSIQPKPTNQSSLATVRNVEAISRQNPTQHGKAVSVSRRPLPAILPKTIPAKALTTISSPGRKLASILPAPAKSTSSSLPNSLLVPVVVSSSSTPIPIAPSPHPPQTPASTNSIMSKVTTASMVTGQSNGNLKRDAQDTSLFSFEAKSPVLLGKSPSGSQGSSPMSSKSLDNIHERETLSPVNEILTLVTSPSSVPYVPSSPIKSLATSTPTSSEISLECDENLFEEFIKDDDIPVNKRTPVSSSIATQDNTESRKDVLSSLDLIKQTLQDTQRDPKSDITHVGHSLQELNKKNDETGQLLENTSTKTSDEVTGTFDLSPLVNELISSSPFFDDSKELKDIVPSNVTQTNTVVTGNTVSDLYVGELPVLDICSSDLNDLSSNSNVSDPATKEKENVPKQLDTTDALLQQGKAETDIKTNADNLTTESKQHFAEMKKDAPINDSDTKQEAESNAKSPNFIEQGKKLSSSQSTVDMARSDLNDRLNDKPRDNIVGTDKSAETLYEQRLLKYSKLETSKFPDDVLKNEGNLNRTSQSKNNDVISVDTTGPASEESQDIVRNKQFSESCRGTNISNKNNEDKQQLPGSCLERELRNPKGTVDAGGEDINNEMLKSSTQEDADGSEVLDKMSDTTITQAAKTEEVPQEQSSKDDDEKQENIDEQLSGSEIVSPEESLVRTSNRKRKAPPPRDLSLHPPGWVRSALQLLQKVSRFRGSSRSKNARSAASWFLKPVAASEAPGYYKVIKNPMDFGTIKTKLEASEYNTPSDFHHDMLLVKSNCCKYNPPGHIVRKDCDEVFNFYEAEYDRFIEKLDKIYLPTPKKQKSSPL